jgi:hypothetical protein
MKQFHGKAIYKYQIEVTDEQTLTLPINAQILAVQTQWDSPCIWAMIDPKEKQMEQVTIRIWGTGHPIADSESLTYLGTFQMLGGQLVFHVFRKQQ